MRTVVVGFSVDDTAESLRAMLRLIRSEGGAHFDLVHLNSPTMFGST